MRPRLLVLVSGGLDSAVALAWASLRGHVSTLSLDRMGRPPGEVRAQRRILEHYRVKDVHVATYPTTARDWVRGDARRAYIPARNLFHAATAILVARRIGARWIVLGHTADDAREFPDARRPFYDAIEDVANAARARGELSVSILTPFLGSSKREVVELGLELEVPIDATWSCYASGRTPCSRCVACRDRAKALRSVAAARPPARPPGPVRRRAATTARRDGRASARGAA